MNLHTLDVSGNHSITDQGLKHLNLHTLKASMEQCNITDDGIKHMDLHTLYATENNKITDEGIKRMNLHTLDASYNHNITDRGIKVRCAAHFEVIKRFIF